MRWFVAALLVLGVDAALLLSVRSPPIVNIDQAWSCPMKKVKPGKFWT